MRLHLEIIVAEVMSHHKLSVEVEPDAFQCGKNSEQRDLLE